MQVLKAEVRARIIRAARSEFLKKGFKETNMRDISKKAGMTVGNIYRYYKNKEDLLFGAVGTRELSAQLWDADLKGFHILLEKKLSKAEAVMLLAEIMTVEQLIEVGK